MRIRLIILVILCGFWIGGKAQQIDEMVENANSLYREQQYQSALTIYDSINSLGYESALLYYNMGNTYYKLKEIPQSILYYEKALKLDPKNEKINQNLSRAKLLTIDRIEEIPEFFLLNSYREFVFLLNSNTWAVISCILFVISLIAFLVFFLSTQTGIRRLGFYLGFVLLLLSAGTLLFANKSYKMFTVHNSAVIMQATVTLKGSPNENSSELYIVHEGTKVFILDSIDEWYEVRLTDGKKGWVRNKSLELI